LIQICKQFFKLLNICITATILAKLVVYISCSSVYFRYQHAAAQEDYGNRQREQGEANNGS
jgi:hypothetical protein